MIIKRLKLKDFRNYENLDIEFEKGLNVIAGSNGVGKTNVVEAIYYLSFARSFRTLDHYDLIKSDKEFAIIDALIEEDSKTKQVHMVINKDGQKIICNKKEISKLSEMASITNVIVFEPRDVLIFQNSPKVRRSYLNIQLSKMSSAYLNACSNCAKLTKERNLILKMPQPNMMHLEIVTNQLIDQSYIVSQKRKEYLKVLEPLVNKTLKAISFTERQVSFHYEPFVKFENKEEFLTNAQNAFKEALENDLKKKTTTIGVHHEDFSTSLNEVNIATFGSQGEKRMAAIALKIAPYFLIEEREKRPIVVLDDVMSELDEKHCDKLLKFLEKFNQVFITTTEIDSKYEATMYDVANKNIARRYTHGR